MAWHWISTCGGGTDRVLRHAEQVEIICHFLEEASRLERTLPPASGQSAVGLQTLRTDAPATQAGLKKHFLPARASGALLDWNTGKPLATIGEQRAARPGSLLKPFLLAYALQHGIVHASTRVYCRRTLQVAGRSLACTHPNDDPALDAEGALAASCNTWFAALARRMTPQDLLNALRLVGLPPATEQLDEPDMRVLTALGLANVSATPMQMAAAYRTLLLRESPAGAVWKGLRGSVAYGMANNARCNTAEVVGKTGTAKNPGEAWSHGWFAGGVPGQFVLVVYVPHGDGGIAATVAGEVFRHLLHEGV